VAAGDIVTVTGPEGVSFDYEGTTENGGDFDDLDLLISMTDEAVVAVDEEKAIGSFSIMAGIEDTGNEILQVTVYEGVTGVDLLGAAVPFTLNGRTTAAAVVQEINDGTGTHGYVAASTLGVIFIYAPAGDGAAANGRVIEIEVNGEVAIYDGKFAVTAGTSGAGNELVMVRVNGLAIMSAPVAWTTSNSNTAALIAANINAFASVPKMVAVAIGETVYVSPEVCRSDDPSAYTIEIETGGDVDSDDGDNPPDGDPGTENPTPERPGGDPDGQEEQ
jgi:hypothetical protein